MRKLGPAAPFYTTRASAADIDAVRQALGFDKIALYGSSYGTKLALAYSVLYPARLDRLVLDSVVPLDEGGFDLDSFQAIPRVLDKLCATGCEQITTDPVADTARLVATMRRRGVLKGTVIDARDGGTGRASAPSNSRRSSFPGTTRPCFAPPIRARSGPRCQVT